MSPTFVKLSLVYFVLWLEISEGFMPHLYFESGMKWLGVPD